MKSDFKSNIRKATIYIPKNIIFYKILYFIFHVHITPMKFTKFHFRHRYHSKYCIELIINIGELFYSG